MTTDQALSWAIHGHGQDPIAMGLERSQALPRGYSPEPDGVIFTGAD